MNEYPSIADLIELMEALAPPDLAEKWDNCGLQLGSPDWKIHKIWVALDPLPEVIEGAAKEHVGLLITHHPLFFKPISAIDLSTPLGKIIATAVKARTAVYSAHTNLDSAPSGTNEILASIVGIRNATPLVPVRLDHDTGAVHGEAGLGRIGLIQQAVNVRQIAIMLKERLKLQAIRIVGDPQARIERAAVCSGSGGSFIDEFLQSDAQVYISGDIRYHEARHVEAAGKALIDLGHFASEHIVISDLVDRLQKGAEQKNWKVDISACRLEKEPFYYL
jgi:dinuclear metal center YbgI/SA1388 family protein